MCGLFSFWVLINTRCLIELLIWSRWWADMFSVLAIFNMVNLHLAYGFFWLTIVTNELIYVSVCTQV